MTEVINAATPPPSDDLIANSLIYLVGNFHVKLFYLMPRQVNGGRSRGSRSRLDFDLVMREVIVLYFVEHFVNFDLFCWILRINLEGTGNSSQISNRFLMFDFMCFYFETDCQSQLLHWIHTVCDLICIWDIALSSLYHPSLFHSRLKHRLFHKYFSSMSAVFLMTAFH